MTGLLSPRISWWIGVLTLLLGAAPSGRCLAAEPSPCRVAGVEGLTSEMEQLERQILLTRYADAVEGLRALQREMTCIGEPPEARLLGRLFLNMGYALHRLGLVSDGEQAFGVAAGIDPGLTWNATFAASYGVKYYEMAQQVRNGPTVQLKVGPVGEGAAWYIDGRLQPAGATEATIHPGWHFVQVARGSAWIGDWYNLHGEVSLDLAGLVRRLDTPEAGSGPVPVAAAAAQPAEPPADGAQGSVEGSASTATADAPSPADGQRTTLLTTAVLSGVGGVGLLVGSIRVGHLADETWALADGLTTSGGTQEEIDEIYYNQYLPQLRRANGMRVAGGALVGVGVGVAILAATVPRAEAVSLGRSRLRLVASPGGVGLAGAF